MACTVWATLLSPVSCHLLTTLQYLLCKCMLWHVQCELHRYLLSPVICLPLYSICYVNVCYGMYSVSYTAVSCHLLTTLQYLLCIYMLWHVQYELHCCLLPFAYHCTVLVMYKYVMACSMSYTAGSCHLLTTRQYLLCKCMLCTVWATLLSPVSFHLLTTLEYLLCKCMLCTVWATLLSPGGWTARTPAPPTPHSAGGTRYMILLYSYNVQQTYKKRTQKLRNCRFLVLL
jgi:hypothetical protein